MANIRIYDKDDDILIFYAFRQSKDEFVTKEKIAKLQRQKLSRRGIKHSLERRLRSIKMRIQNFKAMAKQKGSLDHAAELTRNVYWEWKSKLLEEHREKCVEILKKEGFL